MSRSGSRALIIGALTLTMLLTLGALSATTVAPASASAAPAKSAAVRIGTYNIRAGVGTRTFKKAVDGLRSRSDLAGLQEVNSKSKEAALRRMTTWSYYRAPYKRGEQNPVMWRKSTFQRLSAKSVRTAPGCNVGRERRSVNWVRPHYATVVRLQHRATHRRIVIVNAHLLPGAIKGGKPVASRPRTFRCYIRELRNLRSVVKAQRAFGKVFAVGDFNVGFVADKAHRRAGLPIRRFKEIDMRSMWATERPARKGTHRDALVDQVFSTQRATRASVLRMGYSDHRPGVAAYRLTR